MSNQIFVGFLGAILAGMLLNQACITLSEQKEPVWAVALRFIIVLLPLGLSIFCLTRP